MVNRSFPVRRVAAFVCWLAFMFCGAGSPAHAVDWVTSDQAKLVAERWVGTVVSAKGEWAGSAVPVVAEVVPVCAQGGRGPVVAYRAAVSPAGYVLVSAVRDLPPVKSYSTTGSFDASDPFLEMLVNAQAQAVTAVAQAAAARGGMDTTANRKSWDAVLAPASRDDGYSGIPGVELAVRDSVMANAVYQGNYQAPCQWTASTPFTRKCPPMRSVPEEIWVDTDGDGRFSLGDFILYDADGKWNTKYDSVVRQAGLYFWDKDGQHNLDPNAATLDTVVAGAGYTSYARDLLALPTDKLLSGENLWKDEAGGRDGIYDEGIDTRIFPYAVPGQTTSWEVPHGAAGSQLNVYYTDEDGSADYTFTTAIGNPGSFAVRLAQVMRFYEWPDIGVGSHTFDWLYAEGTATDPNLVPLTANFEHVYSWGQMPLRWQDMNPVNFVGAEDIANARIDNIAQLIYDVAVCLEVRFQRGTPKISFSTSQVQRFASSFRYNHRAIEYVTRAGFPTDFAWFERLRQELDAQRPVALNAFFSETTFTSILIDGYDVTAGAANLYLFHCLFNGREFWYALDNIDGQPWGTAISNVVSQQSAYVGVLPQRTRPLLLAELFRQENDNANGVPLAAAVSGLAAQYGNKKLVTLSYFPNSGDGKYPVPQTARDLTANRVTRYGTGSNPVTAALIVNGNAATKVAGSGNQATDTVRVRAEIERQRAAPAKYRIVGECVLGMSSGVPAVPTQQRPVFKADVYVSRLDEEAPETSALALRLVLAENIDANNQMVVRQLLNESVLNLTTGKTQVVSVSDFPLPPAAVWNLANCQVIAFLENGNGGIEQAVQLAKFDPGPNYKYDADLALYRARVTNRAPLAPTEVVLTQQTDGKTLEATPAGAYDPDGDAIYYVYDWYADDSFASRLIGTSGTSTLDTSTVPGVHVLWRCEVRVRDEYYDDATTATAGKTRLHESPAVLSNELFVLGAQTVVNNAPTAPALLRIVPLNPAEDETIVCLAAGSEDVDGDIFSYLFSWSKGGPVYAGAALPFGVAKAGEVWTCSVLARDVWGAGSAVKTATVTIGAPRDGTPTAPLYVNISPPEPSYVSTLRCGEPSGIVSSDPYEVHYRWWKKVGTSWVPAIVGGLCYNDANGDGVYSAGEDIWLDRAGAGAFPGRYDAGIDAQVYAGVDSLWTTPGGTTGITDGLAFNDADGGDSYTTGEEIWADQPGGAVGRYDNGIDTKVFQPGASWATADGTIGFGDAYAKLSTQDMGTLWRCEVYARNSVTKATGPSTYSAEVLVRNYRPTDPAVAVTPESAKVTDDLACIATGSVDKEEGDNISYFYTWFVNEQPSGIAGIGLSTVPANRISSNEIWRCEVYAVDSYGGRSQVVKSVNSVRVGGPPTAPTRVELSTERPNDDDDLTPTAIGSVDPDGDPVSYLYEWFREEQLPLNAQPPAPPDGLPSPRKGYYWKSMYKVRTVFHPLTAYGERWACLAKATDGLLYSGETGSKAVVIGNQPPQAPGVALSPAQPRAGESIQCVITSPSVDPENDGITYNYNWYRKGDVVPAYTGAILPAGTTKLGESWYCEVIAVDNWTPPARSSTISDAVTFVNLPPSAPGEIYVTPAFPLDVQDLMAVVSGATDPNGDPIHYEYKWYKNGVEQAGLTTERVSAALTADNDLWRVAVRALDNFNTASEWVTSSSVKIGNAPPGKPTTVTITPSPAGLDQDLVCAAGGATDPNGDPVSYSFRWYVTRKGSVVENFAGVTTYRLPAANLNAAPGQFGDTWRCEVWASDQPGSDSEHVFSTPVTIQNLSPSAPTSVTVSPALPTQLADLVCAASGSVDPEGTAVVYSYRWYRNDVLTELQTQTVPAAKVAVGESWACEVHATDADGNTSPAVTSAAVTIRSAAPSNPVVTVTPITPSLTSGLLCTADKSVDPLGGVVTYSYAWHRKGDERVYDGGDGWGTVQGAPGIQAGLYYYDADRSGSYSPGENIWKDIAGGNVGVYDDATDLKVFPVTASDWTAPGGVIGVQTGLYYRDTGANANVYDAGEDIWADRGGGATAKYDDGTAWRDTGITSASVLGAQGFLWFGDVWKCVVFARNSANLESGHVTSNEVQFSNRPPSAPTQVVLSPAVPVINGTLTCNASGSLDPDGASVRTYHYRWQNDSGIFNGAWHDANLGTQSIATGANNGYRWRCLAAAVDPYDSTLVSAEVASNEVRVTGHPPTSPPNVAVTQEGAYLVCRASGSTDQETAAAHLTYLFAWFRNAQDAGLSGVGVLETGVWVNRVPLAFAANGEIWTCQVTVIDVDGTQSDPADSATQVVNKQVLIANNPPQKATSAAIWPASPTLNNFLLCRVGPTTPVDPDQANGDTAVYFFRWFRDGIEQTAYNGPQLPASAIRQGEHWYCEVYARDTFGSTSDSLRSAEVVIGAANGDNFEVDNDASLASAIGANEWQARSLTAGSPQDVDWVLLRLDGASEVRIQANLLSGTAALSVTLYEKNETTNVITRLATGSADLTRMLKPGAYLILVQATNALTQTVVYGLQTTSVSGRSIGSGTAGEFTQTPSDPEDWFHFVLSGATTVSLTAAVTGGTGNLLLSVSDATYQNTYGGTGAALTNQNLAAGHYFVRVAGSGIPGGGSLVYRLTLAPAGVAVNALPLPPTVVQLLPEAPPDRTELRAVAYGARKPDGTPASALRYWFSWYQNGLYRPDLSGLKSDADNYRVTRVDPAYVKAGDTWRCDVYVRDDYDGSASGRVSSGTVTIGALSDWSVTIQAAGTAQNQVMFGQAQNATNGWDEGIDELAPRLGFPSAGVQIYFAGNLPGGVPVYFSKDYRSLKDTRQNWALKVNPRDVLQLTWDATGVPDGLALILTQVPQNTFGHDIDMRTQNSLSLAGLAGDSLAFQISVVPVGISVERITLYSGWNLISFTLSGVDDQVGSVFGGQNTGGIWGFSSTDNRYATVTTILPKVGYWAFAASAAPIVIEHLGRPDLWGKVTLNSGWNLIGPARTCVVPFHPAISRNSVFGYDAVNGRYEYGTLLKANQGYWVSASEAVEVEFK